MTPSEMETCLKDIVSKTNLVYSRERNWGFDSVVLMPPAPDAEIRALSESCPFPLPPGYVQFLNLHNGALGFWLRMTLLGTSGECRDKISAELKDAREHQKQFVSGKDGKVTEKKIAAFEKPTDVRKCLYLPNHTVFGTNERGQFLVFNERKATKTGELQVVDYTYSGDTGPIYPSFPAYLLGTQAFLEKRIKDKKY